MLLFQDCVLEVTKNEANGQECGATAKLFMRRENRAPADSEAPRVEGAWAVVSGDDEHGKQEVHLVA